MSDLEIDERTRESVLRNLRIIHGGELPAWGTETLDAYVKHIVAMAEDAPAWTDEQIRRIAALMRPYIAR